MDQIRTGCVEMQWDPETRLCFVRYHDGPKATAEDGRKLAAAITVWVGPQPKPFAIPVDGGKVQGGQPGFRGVMWAFFKTYKEQVLFALFDLGPALRFAAEMFAQGAGLRVPNRMRAKSEAADPRSTDPARAARGQRGRRSHIWKIWRLRPMQALGRAAGQVLKTLQWSVFRAPILLGTLKLKAFAAEDQARAWLRKEGARE